MDHIKACVFDAYGTLFDVHAVINNFRAELGQQAEAMAALWRSKQLEYTWLRTLMQRHADFWHVTGEALDYAMAAHGYDNPDLRHRLMQAYLSLDCYPEVPEVLTRLKAAGRYQTAILSNGSPTMLQAATQHAGLADTLDMLLSVEAVGMYKTAPPVYQLAVDRLGVAPAAILFLSTNAWDVAGAASFGLTVAWVNRFNQRPEALPYPPTTKLTTLRDLLSLLNLK